jgi:exosortase
MTTINSTLRLPTRPAVGLPSQGAFRTAKFWLMIGGLAAVWSVIPYYFPSAVASWLDNPEFPKVGYWVLLSAAVTIYFRQRFFRPTPCKWPVIIVGVLMYVPLYWGRAFEPYWIHYYFVAVAAIIVYGCGGRSWIKVIGPALIILLLLPAIPPPVYGDVVEVLKETTTQFALFFSQTFLSPEYRRFGDRVFLPVTPGTMGVVSLVRLWVVDECSGIRSFLGMIILSTFWAADFRVSIVKKLLLCIAAVALAIGSNLVRVGITAVLFHEGHDELTRGLPHSALGQMIYFGELAVLYGVYRWFSKTGSEDGERMDGTSAR